MKNIFSFLLLSFLANVTSAQYLITPSETLEYCPNTNITFAVTISGYEPFVFSWTNNPTLISANYPPANPAASTPFSFVGSFRDVNIAQTFGVKYKRQNKPDTIEYITFKKIKSLFYPNPTGNSQNSPCQQFKANQTQITAPLCEIVNIPISVNTANWSTFGEGNDFCWGAITTYDYQLPNGWSIGSNVSTGNNWIAGGTSVTVTSDLNTGGVIKIRPTNNCAAGLANNGTQATIAISRPGPTFSLSPTSVSIQCGTPLTQTFTVSMTGTTTCPVTYSWNLGDNNGWFYNGNPAPTTPFTAPASITLTSLSVAPFFANVTVTPLLNGIAQPALTAATGFQAPNLGLVGGSSSICTGTSAPFYLYNAPANSSIFWGTVTTLPNYGATVVQVDNPYSNSTTLTKINSGVVNLTVSVRDACNQTYLRTRENILVGGYANTSAVTGYTLAYPPCYTQGCTPTPVSNPINTNGPYGTTVYSATAYLNTDNTLTIYNPELANGTWSLLTGSVLQWSSTGGSHLTFYPGGTNGSFVQFRLTNNNACGTQYYDFNFYPVQYNPPYYYIVSPNPATTSLLVAVDETKLTTQKIVKSTEQDIKEITILDKMGTVVKKQTFGTGIRQINLNVSDLRTGYYVLKIFNGKQNVSLKFIKE